MSAAPSKSGALRLTLFVLHDSQDGKQPRSWGPSWAAPPSSGAVGSPTPWGNVPEEWNGAEQSCFAAGIWEMPGINKDRIPTASQHLLCVVTGYYGMESGYASLAFGIAI